LKGKPPIGVTSGWLRLLKYGSRELLEALAKLCGQDEGFDERVLPLEARSRILPLLEKAYEAGEVTEEEVLDGVLALGRAEDRSAQITAGLGFKRDWNQ
jgi:hypothetical protein